jgi:lysophospholipid acyltransferase (LPLAT)-like uncharacterized protein
MSSPSPFTLSQRLILRLAPPLIAGCLRLLAASWRSRVLAPPRVLPGESDGPNVYAIWHDGILAITGQWRDHAIQGLASQSFDGELIAKAMEHLGYPRLSRGSSSRGGEQAMSMQMEALRAGRHIVVTMDGPRGPRHECKAGTAVMAARGKRPLVPVLCASRMALRLRNWDRTLLPLPFAKVVFVLGEPIQVAETGVQKVLERLPRMMDQLEEQARNALWQLDES